MKSEKTVGQRAFRPWPKNGERLEYAQSLGLNVSEVLNEILERHLRDFLAEKLKSTKAELEDRQKKLSHALNTPLP